MAAAVRDPVHPCSTTLHVSEMSAFLTGTRSSSPTLWWASCEYSNGPFKSDEVILALLLVHADQGIFWQFL